MLGFGLLAGLQAQTWTGVFPTTVPPQTGFASQGLAYNADTQKVIMFGGAALGSPRVAVNDTWEWTGFNWTLLNPEHRPPPRSGLAMVYDANRRVIVMFGGRNHDGIMFSDTWEWNGNDWIERHPVTSPSPRRQCAAAYHAKKQHTVLFGGIDAVGQLGETWIWNGIDWIQKFPSSSPSARFTSDAVYHASRSRVLLFGGLHVNANNTSDRLSDTWEWDGTRWRQRITGYQPSGRENHAMAYDSIRGLTVLFSGAGTGGLADTWEWSGSAWTQRFPITSPPYMWGHSMVYDEARRRIFMYGGFLNAPTTTWEYGDPVGNPPAPNFTGTPTSGVAPLNVTFTDSSTSNPISWLWDFGDGGTSSAQDPQHSYTSAGTYTVVLTATNANGSETLTRKDYITVSPAGGFTGEGFKLSKNADFSTDDRVFSRTDTLYMLMWSDRVDHTNMRKTEWSLKDANRTARGTLTNNNDNSHTAAFNLSELPGNSTSWAFKGKLEDNNRKKLQRTTNITVN